MKELPYSLEAEKNLIGSSILDNTILDETTVTSDMLHNRKHRVIWDAMQALHQKDQPPELHTLTECLRSTGMLSEAGGVNYLIGLTDETGTGAFWSQYEATIKERYWQREIIKQAGDAMNHAYAMTPPNEIVQNLESFVTTATVEKREDINYAIEAAKRYATGDALIPTGFRAIDEKIGGFTRGDFTFIAARTSSGKSQVAYKIAQHIAKVEGAPVFFMTPDQSITEILALQAARECGIPLSKFRHKLATERDQKKYLDAAEGLKEGFLSDIWFRQGGISLQQVELESVRAIRRGASAIFLDTVNRVQAKNKVEMLAELGTLAKQISAEYDVPFIGLGQLRRETDWKEDAPPGRDDIADAPGTLGNDPNTILLLQRRENIMNVYVEKVKADKAGQQAQLFWAEDFAEPRDFNG